MTTTEPFDMPRKPTRPLHPLRMAEAPTPAPAPEETISAIKGFNRDWMCRDFQFEIGATGDRSASSVHGEKSCAMACGHEGKVLADKDGCALFLTRRDPDSGDILHAWAGISGRDGIKAGAWYSLDADGKPGAIP